MDSIDKNHTHADQEKMLQRLLRPQAKPVHFISLAPRRLRHPSIIIIIEFATNPPKLVPSEKNLKTLKLLPVYNSNIKVASASLNTRFHR